MHGKQADRPGQGGQPFSEPVVPFIPKSVPNGVSHTKFEGFVPCFPSRVSKPLPSQIGIKTPLHAVVGKISEAQAEQVLRSQFSNHPAIRGDRRHPRFRESVTGDVDRGDVEFL